MEMTETQYEASVLATGAELMHNNFPQFRAAVRETIAKNLEQFGGAIFISSTKRLSTAYVEGFATEHEQKHHDCAACRDFIRKFGTAVVIDENNKLKSLMWDPETVPEDFKASVQAMKIMAERGIIREGVRFDIHGANWGSDIKGGWTHLYYDFDHIGLSELFSKSGVSIPKLSFARENAKYLKVNLEKYKPEVIRKAAALMASGRIKRTDAFSDWINWILDAAEKYEAIEGVKERDNFLWSLVARLPATGWASFAGGMPGMMFDMIIDERVDQAIVNRFNEASDSLNYQRQTSELTEGQAARAEDVIKKLDREASLERRLANYEEIRELAVWEKPAPEVKPEEDKGIFGSLVGKKPGQVDTPIINDDITKVAPMTFLKFLETVVPQALDMHIGLTAHRISLAQWMGPVHRDAKPIFLWDKEEHRYPYCWIQLVDGVTLPEVNLVPGWVEVTSLMKAPWMINDGGKKLGKAYGAVLKDAKSFRSSYDLFPETLIGELHEVRAGVEAYRASRHVEAKQDAVLAAPIGPNVSVHFRVRTKLGWFLHHIDRFD